MFHVINRFQNTCDNAWIVFTPSAQVTNDKNVTAWITLHMYGYNCTACLSYKPQTIEHDTKPKTLIYNHSNRKLNLKQKQQEVRYCMIYKIQDKKEKCGIHQRA